ncbi:hypothetical protein LJE86_13850, partial [bacterium BMS3Abin03]|nr:hypothetical protein [bacterium BMS3Abin03]
MKSLIPLNYCLFFFLCSSIFAQNSVLNPTIDSDLNFKKINFEFDGEEVFDVARITQDHQGYMWMATNLGLIKFNGIKGRKYAYSDTPSSTDYIESLFVDHKGDLWIGANSGLSKYNSDCDSVYRYSSNKNYASIKYVQSIAEDKNGDIWIGTQKGELFHYKRESDRISRFLFNPSDSSTFIRDGISFLLVDQNNNLWIGTYSYQSQQSSGLIRMDIDSGEIRQFLHDPTNPNSLSDNRISALYEDQQGQILIGTYKCGLHIYSTKSDSLIRINRTNNIHQLHAPYTESKVFSNDPYVGLIHQDQNEDYWIGTSGIGINHFNTKTRTFENYSFNLTNPQLLWTIYEDRQG